MSCPWDYPAPVAQHPVVTAVRGLVEDVLVPTASAVALSSVDRDRIDLVAAAGALSPELPIPIARAVDEMLAGACGATGFVVSQHTRPARLLARHLDAHPDGELADIAKAMRAGQVLATTAFTHLRRPGPPQVTARPSRGGWVIDGRVDWVSSWGLADVLHLAARTTTDQVLSVIVPAQDARGLQAGPAMSLLAMTASRTVTLQLDGLVVPSDRVVDTTPFAVWSVADAEAVADARPGAFGLLGAIVDRLAAGAQPGSGQAELAAAAAVTACELRDRCYSLADRARADEQPDPALRAERIGLRANQLVLLTQSASALVASGGGRATLRGSDAERMVSEAMFHLVSGQTLDVRDATLRAFVAN